ncbi:MAG: hypothetical protein KME17_12475 [Cyanosarcina radialis HA8281-LM2]|jgi:hypothetical protein|nr:hypothetical protein [Cyanosarcina radialis HA8281-LM2]
MNRTKAIAALTITLISSAATSTLSYAADLDYKSINGSACYPSHREDVGTVDRTTSLENKSERDVLVSCPIVRDRVTSSTNSGGSNPFGVEITINGKGKITACFLRTLTKFDSPVADSFASSNGSRISLSVPKTDNDGSHLLQCLVPPNGKILRYQYFETNPTDRFE